MDQAKNLYRSVICLLLMATLHFSALHYFLYWRFRLFDILPHLAGGMGVGFGLLWLFSKFKLPENKYSNLFVFLIISSLIFFAWEFFEYSFGLSFVRSHNYALDTIKDLSAGLIGVSLALFYNQIKK
jgi:hypothetical protein